MKLIYIPLDLQINTLLRLPVKSLSRFRCVSKLWSSIITSLDFRNRHLKIASSSAPPCLLIAFKDFYGEKHLVVRSDYLSLVNIKGKLVYNACRGLICVGDGFKDVGICNPSTRQLHTFPQSEFKDFPIVFPRPDYILRYDPVEDQYKVLAVVEIEAQGCDIGRRRSLERGSMCRMSTHCLYTGLYMNGTVYYGADSRNSNSMIVSFNVRLETFKIIKVPSKLLPLVGYQNMWGANKTLINYKGKIGVVENPRKGIFRMWVVEDADKEKWSMSTFHLPESAAGLDFKVMNTFSTGEICLVPKELSDPFCLCYYNLKRNSMRSVIIEGLPVSERKRLSVTVSDHYESLMFLKT